MNDEIHVTATMSRKNGQWKLWLNAPSWVIEDLIQTMKQTRPGVLVYASATYTNGKWEGIYFTTWGGGAIGSGPKDNITRSIELIDPPRKTSVIDAMYYQRNLFMTCNPETGRMDFFSFDENGQRQEAQWDGSGNIRYHDWTRTLKIGQVFDAGPYHLRVVAPAIDDYLQWPLVAQAGPDDLQAQRAENDGR